jgi:putative addiction module CopG family antidote
MMERDLPAELAEFVRDEVAAGRYLDGDDVIRDAVRRLAQARWEADRTDLAHLRQALNSGLADAMEGRLAEGGIMDSAARAAGG